MQLFVSFYSYKQRPGCNQYTHVSGNTITGHTLSHPQGLTNESTLYRGCVTTHINIDCVSDKSLYDHASNSRYLLTYRLPVHLF